MCNVCLKVLYPLSLSLTDQTVNIWGFFGYLFSVIFST